MEPRPSIMDKPRDAHFYWTLFKATFLVSAFTVGGGFIIIPLLKAKYVDEYHWINDKDALDMVAVAQSMPGVIAANCAIILGYRMAGVLGTLVALVATILPPLITLSIVSYCYDYFVQSEIVRMILRGMQCGATALIVNVAIDLLVKQVKKKLECILDGIGLNGEDVVADIASDYFEDYVQYKESYCPITNEEFVANIRKITNL